MQDRWTNGGYTSTGPNLTRGVVAVNPKVHAIGTVFRDRKTGEAFVAADRHGNVNPRVENVFENPANYKAALAGQRDLQVVGKLDKVPKTKEGVQEALQKFHQRKGPAAADKDPYRPQLDAPQHAANPGTATEGAEVFRGSGREPA